MRKYLLGIAGSGLLAAGLLASCSSTSMISHWRDPSYAGGKLQKVMVIGVAANPAGRRMFEDTFSSSLNKRKIQAFASYQTFPDAGEITQEGLEAYAREQGFTQILVARIVDRQTIQEYVPPTVTTYAPSYPGYYGGWYPYYSTSYTTMVSPGYTYERSFVTVETNVYDVSTAKMIWNGMTETEIGSTVQAHLAEYIDVVVGYMGQDKLL